MSQNPLVKIKILVVDDDSISLAIVSSMLKTCSLQDQLIELSVITERNGIDALSTIQAQDEKFDLVIVDFHVPGKNGWELQKQVDKKFKIPVIFMFSDRVESIIANSLDSGAVFHIVKPVKQQDIKKAWECAVASKKGKSEVVVDQETMAKNKSIEEEIGSSFEQEVSSASSVNEESSQKGKKRIRDGEDEVANIAPKKAKIIWTNSLHNRFLQAINHIGLEKAVPKRILEFMNVPGLTRENVASHLQKYRMFLKKVAERGLWTSHGMSERILRSSFATGYNPSLINSPISLSNSTFPFSRYHHQPSAANSPPLLRPGQSSLLAASSTLHRPPFSGSNPFSLHNPSRYSTPPLHSNNAPPLMSSMYQNQNQNLNQNQSLGSSFQNFASPSPYLQSGNYASFPPSNPNATNYACNGEIRTGQMLPVRNLSDLSTGLPNLGYSATNWSNRTAIDNGFLGNIMSGYVPNTAAGFSSSNLGNCLGQGRGTSFGTAANQISMPFNVGNRENSSVLSAPLMSQQNANAGLGNDFGFNLFNDVSNNPGTSCNNNNNPSVLLEDCDLDLVFGSLNSTTPFQHQNVEGAVNIDSSYQPEINTNDFLNVEFSNSCTLLDNAPSNEQGSHEIQSASVEETVNADFGANGNSMDSYIPSFNEAQTQSNPDEQMDSDLIGMAKAIRTSDENQGWGEDFLDILLGNNPY